MYRILLVDDEPMIKMGMRKLLEGSDYIIAGTANNGMEALSLLEITPADIILTDLKMPVMDGIELIRHLKSLDFDGIILALSNYSDFDLVRTALTEGAADYLLKTDITREHLLKQLGHVSKELDNRMKKAIRADEYRLKNQRLLAMEWQDYLNGLSDVSNEAKSLLFPSSETASVHILAISFSESMKDQERQRRSAAQIKDILPDIFNASNRLLILQTDTSELLCLIPSSCIQNLSAAIWQVQRRINMYFNVMPIISYLEDIKHFSAIKPGYQACTAALGYRFYDPDIFVFPANEYPPFASEDIVLFDAFLGDMSDGYSYQNKDLVYTAVHTYLQKCSQQRMPPKWVIDTCCHCAERMLLANRPAKDNTALLTLSQQLHMADSASQLAELLLQFLFETATPDAPDSALMSSKKEIQKVLSYIQSHYTSQLTLEDIAEHVNLNKSYLCRIFKQQMDISIFSYINQLRMERSAQFIRENSSNCNIREAASSVGIEDPFYFTRKFKAYWGKSPSEYAKNNE